jgi:peptide/nickel transport system ATP-binding protein
MPRAGCLRTTHPRWDPMSTLEPKPPALVTVSGLSKRFEISRPWLIRTLGNQRRRLIHAIEDVGFEIARGKTFALVGESGCGKSTLARCLVGVLAPDAGQMAIGGRLQMIFQDPYSSLDPSWRADAIIAEPLKASGLSGKAERRERVAELLTLVGLTPDDGRKFPHQFSGGQRQRISIARALSINPAFLIADEPTSALDVSVQAQILNLMRDLQDRLGLTFLFISHNLAAVSYMADEIGVMYLGRLVETGPAPAILTRPLHPYTKLLFEAVPDIDVIGRRRAPLKGELPSPTAPPSGCAFHPRCPLATSRCSVELPLPRSLGGVRVACHEAERMGREARAYAGRPSGVSHNHIPTQS